MKKQLLMASLLAACSISQLFAQIHANFSISGNPNLCLGLPFTFTNSSTGNFNSVLWDFGDNTISNANSPTKSYFSPGAYVVKLTVTDTVTQLSASKEQIITIKGTASAFFNIYLTSQMITPGMELYFENYSNWANSFVWDFGDGNTSARFNGKHTYDTAGTYTITLKAYGGCNDSSIYSTTLQVIDTANMTPSASGFVYPQTACPGDAISFENTSTQFQYIVWDFGDGNRITTTQQTTQHAYSQLGSYEVKLYAHAQNNVDSTTFTVNITDTFVQLAGAYVSPYRMLVSSNQWVTGNCLGSKFKLMSFPALGTTTYWRLHNGSISPDTDLVINQSGIHSVWCISQTSCGAKDSQEFQLYVYPSDSFATMMPYANITPMQVCPGGNIMLNAFISNENDQLNWKLGTSVLNDTNNFQFQVPNVSGPFNITLYLIPECGLIDSSFHTVFVGTGNTPPSNFNVISQTRTNNINCINDSVIVSAESIQSYLLNPVTHFWDFGEGYTATTPRASYKYATPGWKTIMHRTTSSCGTINQSFMSFYVNNNAPPTVRLSAWPGSFCLNDSVHINNLSFGTDSMVLQFGDGNQQIFTLANYTPNISYRYSQPGNYTLRLIAFNRCTADTSNIMINVLGVPSNKLLNQNTTVEPGNSITFRRDAAGVSHHIWLSNQITGGSSTDDSVTITFNSVGTYKVYLRSFNQQGCSETDSVQITVANNPLGLNAELANQKPLAAMYPNPTTGSLQVLLTLKDQLNTKIAVYDLSNRMVRELTDKTLNAGSHVLHNDISDLSNGVYIIHIQAGDHHVYRKLIKN